MFVNKKLLPFFIFVIFLRESKTKSDITRNHRSQARTLTFPPTAPTRVQFICGIGIPVEDLRFEAVTSGYVLKAEYFLPEKAEQFTPNYLKPQNVARRSAQLQNDTISTENDKWRRHKTHDESSTFGTNLKNKQKHASTYRWDVYKAIEISMSNSGLPGRTCLLRSICEHASAPMHYGAGLLAELLHIILTPSTSHDKILTPLHHEYIRAEEMGFSGRDCESLFQSCKKSPVDLLTAVFDLDSL